MDEGSSLAPRRFAQRTADRPEPVEVHEEVASTGSVVSRSPDGHSPARETGATVDDGSVGSANNNSVEEGQTLLVPTKRSKPRGRAKEQALETGDVPAMAAAAQVGRAGRSEERSAAEAAAPTIKVSVGRVEIRALEPAAKKRRGDGKREGAGGGWTPPVLSLERYLRAGGER